MGAFGGAIATIAYNGFTFDERTQTENLSARYKYDTAQRTITATIYALTLRTIIGAQQGITSDALMLDARRRLSVPGKPFRYQNTGFGDLTVNVSNTSKDVLWGPRPQELSCKPIGGTCSWELVWKVEVAIPECSRAAVDLALMEFNYRLAIDQDRQGFTTRTYHGYYIIPQTRKFGDVRTLSDSADAYWESILPELPENFKRELKNRELDESKCRCDFTVVDTEMGPNILPVGITDCRASHTLESGNRGFFQWIGTISADYEIARDYPEEKVYKHFVNLCQQRINNSRANFKAIPGAAQSNSVADAQKQKEGFILLTKLSMAEPEIYGRPLARFSLQYLMYQSFTNILKASSLWLPVGNSWSQWKTSLSNSALHPRGNAKMSFNPNDDVIIDLCLDRNAVAVGTVQQTKQNRRLTNDFGDDKCPKPEDSWIWYDVRLEAESADGVMVHKPLPLFTTQTTYVAVGLVQSGYIQEVQRIVAGTPDDIIQLRTSNSDAVYVVGSALRACYNIDPPILQTIGGRTAVRANRDDEQEYCRTGNLGTYGVPIIWAQWRHRYIIPSRRNIVNLRSVPTVSTPTMRNDGNTTMRPETEVQMKNF